MTIINDDEMTIMISEHPGGFDECDYHQLVFCCACGCTLPASGTDTLPP
jgi:hypothetical protein